MSQLGGPVFKTCGCLPNELESKLQLTVGGRSAADCIEIAKRGRTHKKPFIIVKRRGVYKWVWHGQKRVVQEIEGLEPKLQIQALGDGCGLHGAEIHAHESGAAQNTTMCVPEDLGRSRICESRKIPPIQERLWTTVGTANQVAVVLLETNVANGSVTRR